MDSRENVRLATNYKIPDSVHITMGSMQSSGIIAIAYYNLRKKLNIDKKILDKNL